MHLDVLVPLGSLVGAGALASAVVAREPNRRIATLVSLVLGGIGIWSLGLLLFAVEPDPARAAAHLRWSQLGCYPLGALFLHLAAIGLRADRRLRPLIVAGYACSTLALVVAVATTGTIVGVQTDEGVHTAVTGSKLPLLYGVLTGFPLLGIGAALYHARGTRLPRRDFSAVMIAAVLCLVFSSITDFVLPLRGVDFPHLASAFVVGFGAFAWTRIYRSREPHLTPQKFARQILDALPDGVVLLRLDGRVRSTNASLGTLLDRRAGELVGRPITEIVQGDWERESSPDERECEVIAADGRRIPVSISSSPLADAEGKKIGHVVAIRDLRELVALRSRLVSSGRLVAVGQLAAGIAHEINNPIAYVRSNLKLLGEHWERIGTGLEKARCGPAARFARDEGPALLEEAQEGVEKVAAVVRDVGGFSKAGGVETEAVDLHQLIDRAARIAAPQLKRVELARRYGELPLVPCIPQELMQVFVNLLHNAAQVSPGDGVVEVSTRLEDTGAVVEIADAGPGIPPELHERVFEPFFTHDIVGRGSGLGLSIAQQIVAKHDGEITLDSRPGAGSRFRVLLPLSGGVGPRRLGAAG